MNRRYAQIRKFLELTQFDEACHTGIPQHRISAFERGTCELSAPELAALTAFLRERLRMELAPVANEAESPVALLN
jgi:hypothetical protein